MSSHSLEGDEADTRGIVRSATLEEFRQEPNFAHEKASLPRIPPATIPFSRIIPITRTPGGWRSTRTPAWAATPASISLLCGEQHRRSSASTGTKTGRDMQWIRIDTYFEGDLAVAAGPLPAHDLPAVRERALRAGLPGGATVHTPEGLNMMVYNRCVGTRYCSNNCPYKVRRFNFLLFSDYETESLQADAQSRRHGAQPRRDGEVHLLRAAHQRRPRSRRTRRTARSVTARSSPPASRPAPRRRSPSATSTIKNSRVSKIKAQSRNYGVIADLNTRPRTTYIAEVTQPEPGIGWQRRWNTRPSTG